MSEYVYLIEVVVAVDSIGTTSTLYFSSGHGFVTKPTETPANQFWEPRVKQPALMRRDIYSSGTTVGQSSVGYGEIVLVNNDGGLDYLINYGFDGRPVTIKYGPNNGDYPTDFKTVFAGTMSGVSLRWGEVSLNIRDRQSELASKNLQTTKYAGNNSLPNGLEGVEGDLKGSPKPVCYGRVFNISPPLVNTSRLIYQVNDGAVLSVDKVYDKGAELTKGADYTSQADMEANAPAASNFRVWPGGGYFRLGSSAVGQITADVTQGATVGDRTVAQILKSIAVNRGGVSSGDVNSSDVTALDTANSSEVGIWISDETDLATVMDDISNSIGAWWGFDNLGKLRMARLEVPSGTPIVTLTESEILDIDRDGSGDKERSIPAYSCKVKYKKIFTTQNSDLAGSVTDARRNEVKEEFREVVVTDTSVKNKHLLSPELEFYTLLVDSTSASNEATRLLDIYKTRRDVVNCSVQISQGTSIDLNSVVEIDINRFGYSGGKLFRVIGIETNLKRNKLNLKLWG